MAFILSRKSLSKLEGVHPDLIKLMKEAITDSPYDFMITQGVRTAAYQHELYQQGRSKPGKIVTNADGYKRKSNHQVKADGLGHAVDFAVLNQDGSIDWNTISKYDAVGKHICAVARKLNIELSWGGNWTKFKDYPHVELVRG